MLSTTHKWLSQNVLPYSQRDRVFADIDALLNRFSTLRPKSDIYSSVILQTSHPPPSDLCSAPAYDDGRTQLLLCIHGLLPISFRQVSYNIPVAVWVTREYPRQPPIAYVVPTNDMLVKAGKYVDVSGRCRIEYVQHWERKYEVRLLLVFVINRAHRSTCSRAAICPLCWKPCKTSSHANHRFMLNRRIASQRDLRRHSVCH